MLKILNIKDYSIISETEIVHAESLIKAIEESPWIEGLGRGRIKFVKVGDEDLVVRQYVHGGILRGITRDNYLTEKRVIKEFLILSYLRSRSFFCPEPFCGLIKRGLFSKKLFLVTRRIPGARPFYVILREKKGLERARYIFALAKLLLGLHSRGVFHPDFHLSNVVMDPSGNLFVVDFDRAKLKTAPKKGDLKKMILRLHRYAKKLEKKGDLELTEKEKILFLRTLNRLLRCDILQSIRRSLKRTEMIQKLGWFFESMIYGGEK